MTLKFRDGATAGHTHLGILSQQKAPGPCPWVRPLRERNGGRRGEVQGLSSGSHQRLEVRTGRGLVLVS